MGASLGGIVAGRWIMPAAALILAATSLTSCSVGTAAPELSTPSPSPQPPIATATPAVTFAVAITPVATATFPAPARPRKPRFKPPRGPYLLLSSPYGPPLSRSITVIGGNLPHNVTVQLLWSPHGLMSPISTTAYTDGHGHLSSPFRVPASQPATYRVVADVNGVTYAAATYRVVSVASLQASVVQLGSSVRLEVSGTRFVPYEKLIILAFPLSTSRPTTVGSVRAGRHGRFHLVSLLANLAPGQYVLRALATSDGSMQMAQTFFDVVT